MNATNDATFLAQDATGNLGGESCVAGRHDPLASRRLWSLWDIMQAFPASYFLNVRAILQYYRAFSGVVELGAPPIAVPGGLAAAERRLLSEEIDAAKDATISSGDRGEIDKVYSSLEQNCARLGLRATVATVKKMRQTLISPDATYGQFWAFAPELDGRLHDEIDQGMFFTLSLKEAELYQQPRQGWTEVITRFPGAGADIEECSKCFALGRYAAAVFHSLQAVEVGLIELGRILVVNDPLPGWTATTGRLKAVLKLRYQDRTLFQQQNSSLLEQIDATTETLKGAWRNKVSHVHGKLILMTTDFGPEVAEEILMASRGFMRRLATEAPTSPDPDA